MIRLSTFGAVDLRASDGSELSSALAQPKRLALLIYLAAARPGGVHRRDRLLGLFWPELETSRARDALSQALTFLRTTVAPAVLVRRGVDEVGVNPAELWCDVTAYRAAMEQERWEEVLALYRGDFLRSFFVDGADGFEQWMESERSALRELAARAARHLARKHEAEGALTLAITWGRQALDFAPEDERALRQLLSLHVRAGDHGSALHLYDGFERRLEAEWGTVPSAETRRLIDDVRSQRVPADRYPVDAGGLRPPPPRDPPPAAPGAPTPANRVLAQKTAGLITERYRIERELGTGGTATVYLARDLKHDRDVAVKVLSPVVTEGLARDRFVREIRIAGQLQHPGIVPLFDSGEADGRLYYVMPVVPGETLRQRLRAGPVSVGDTVAILRDVAASLGYAHERGVVHRDIKPENVLLVGPRAVVTDFGIARAAEALVAGGPDGMAVTQPGTSLGTPAYMAPEQAAGDPRVSPLADLYSLGVLGYELLAGRTPFVGSSPQQILAAKLTERAPNVTEFRPDAPLWLADLLMTCLEREPAQRPQSAGAVHDALVMERRPPEGIPSVIASRIRRLGVRRLGVRHVRPRVWAGVAVGVSALAAGLWGMRRMADGTGDPNLVAVLPFRVTGNETVLGELREGVVDLMSIYLTGDRGGLRSVEPATLFRAWQSRRGSGGADLADDDAIALAGDLGAAWLLRGSMVGTGGDVLLRASLVPVGRRGQSIQASVTGPSDSVLAHVPRLLGRILVQLEGISADQSASVTTTSLGAVRAYLAGQRHYRRSEHALAVDRFTEALTLDSSFALAGLGLLMAHEWSGNASEATARAAAETTWRNRWRLRAKDQALIEAVLGPNGSDLSALADVQESREHATIVAADRFESWYLFGDHLFHVGALLGIDQPLVQAENAFRRARNIDPGQAGVLEHLLLLAARRGDTSEVRSLLPDFRRAVPDPTVRFKDEWLIGTLLGDSAMTAEALRHLDDRIDVQTGLSNLTFAVPIFPEMVSPLRGLLQSVGSKVQRREDRERVARLRWWLALDAGRPDEARDMVVAMGQVPPEELQLADIFWGAGRSGVRPTPTGAMGVCAEGVAQARDGRWTGVRHAMTQLSAQLERPSRLPPKPDRVCADLLEAAHAQGTGQLDRRQRVLAVDSLLLTVPYLTITWENLMVAGLLEREGEYRRAAAAATRYRYALGYPSYLSTYLRESARLAALAQERDHAVERFTQYLSLRRHPEASNESDTTDVKRTLAGLTGSRH